jgi:hypothetical protein
MLTVLLLQKLKLMQVRSGVITEPYSLNLLHHRQLKLRATHQAAEKPFVA